jgi:hypothetical protein
VTERPSCARLEVDLSHFEMCRGKRQKRGSFAIDRAHRETAVAQKARMPAASGR